MPDDTLNFDDTIPGSSGMPSEADLAEGSMIGQYRVVRLIGRGGMGQVYEVEHTVLDKSFALKLLPGHLARRPDALARFQREAKVMANLEHEHILRVDDFGEYEGRYFLRMPLVRGVDLKSLGLKGHAVTLQDLADAAEGRVRQTIVTYLLHQVLEGLSYAHAQGAVHRDIKPANILLEPGRRAVQARIADFGLVRIVGQDWLHSQADLSVRQSMSLGSVQTIQPALTQLGSSTRSLIGTYAYMSPEQKDGRQADFASDLYAVGLIAFRCLTGLKEMAFDLPSDVDDSLSPEWDAWVRQALRSQKEKRFASAVEMAAGLRRVGAAISGKKKAAVRAERECRQAERLQADEAARHKRQQQCDQLPAGWTAQKRTVTTVSPTGETQKLIKYYTNSIGMKFVQIEPGEFMMGSSQTAAEVARLADDPHDKKKLEAWCADEHPRHKVQLTSRFLMAATEVTQSQYKAVMGESPSYFKEENSPVEQVSWNDAVGFCKALSKRDGVTYRLPTEAEWEYGCRAGTTTPFYTGATINTGQANYNGNYTYGNGRKGVYRHKTTPAGGFPANPWGLYDMHGNVWEWCQDGYDSEYYGKSPENDSLAPKGFSLVLRGGSWSRSPRYCRSAYRNRGAPTFSNTCGGFRVVVVVVVQ